MLPSDSPGPARGELLEQWGNFFEHAEVGRLHAVRIAGDEDLWHACWHHALALQRLGQSAERSGEAAQHPVVVVVPERASVLSWSVWRYSNLEKVAG